MQAPEDVMAMYIAMWNASDEEQRRRLAEQVMTDDAAVVYPTIEARGRDELVAAVGGLQQRWPGAHFVATSGVEQHHGWLRASWRLMSADEKGLMDGEDVAQVAADGRLRQVIGFHNPLPSRS